MEGHPTLSGNMEDTMKPIFSFARLRRCATVEGEQPSPRHRVPFTTSSSSSSSSSSENNNIRQATTSSSMSSLNNSNSNSNGFNATIYHRHNTNVIHNTGGSGHSSGSSSWNHSFENAPSSPSSSGSTSPTHTPHHHHNHHNHHHYHQQQQQHHHTINNGGKSGSSSLANRGRTFIKHVIESNAKWEAAAAAVAAARINMSSSSPSSSSSKPPHQNGRHHDTPGTPGTPGTPNHEHHSNHSHSHSYNYTRSSSIPPFSFTERSPSSSPLSSATNTPTSPKPRPLTKNPLPPPVPHSPALAMSTSSTTSSSTTHQAVSPPRKEKPVFRRYLSLIIFPSSLKQIPFMVPSSAHGPGSRSSYRPSYQKSLDDCSSPSGKSEPTSPTLAVSLHGDKRPSVEIPGAYALGTIDPSLYKVADEDDHYDIPPDHIGRVWFAAEYERETEKLMITLIKAKNLPSRTLGSDNACDPFVRLYLMPDERRYLQSKCRKKTCNPKFEETYVFQVSHRALEDRVLKLTVCDVDRHKRHQVIGHALYPLREHDCETNVRVVIWRDLEKEVSESTTNKGDLLVSLCYNNHLERLTVGVFETRDLHCTGVMGHHPMDTYTKVCLMTQNKLVKVKKTETVKKTNCPNFNESFTFKVPASNLDNASVSIAVMHHGSGLKDRLVGRIVLGSFMFARGKELEHWNQMIASQREQITHWHTLS